MKPLADHGTTARAKGRPALGVKGCPCTPCRRAEAAYDKKRRVFNATGRNLMVDTEPVVIHLKDLFAAGAGWNQIAEAAGSSTATMHAILTGRVKRCRRTTASKLLAVKAQEVIPSSRPVDAVGSIRRMHALLALGHTNKAITAASGVEHSMLSDLINERVTVVTRHVAERIDVGFRALAAQRGTSVRSLNRARRNNWAPPAAWDDEAIDDPGAEPAYGDETPRYIALAEDCAELERQGHSRAQIAERLGVSRGGLQAAVSYYRQKQTAAADMRKAA